MPIFFVNLKCYYLLFYRPSYTTCTKYKPCGGNVFPAFPLSFSFMILGISSGSIFPSPTSTKVPANNPYHII